MSVDETASNGNSLPAECITPHSGATSLIRAELARIGGRFDAADRRAKQASTIEDREVAEEERREAAGDFWAAEADLADFLLLLLRVALRHQPDALTRYLVQALRPELESLADVLARMEVRQ
jgi:hypothetical protein